MNIKSKSGFTLVETFVVFFIFIIIFIVLIWGGIIMGVVGGVIKGNYWCSEETVLEDLQVDYPETQKVLRINRSAWDPSVVTVEQKDGTKKEYFLDSNILWNYEFTPKEEKVE